MSAKVCNIGIILPTLGQRRRNDGGGAWSQVAKQLTNDVGPTLSFQSFTNVVLPTLSQHWPNVGMVTLAHGQHYDVGPMSFCPPGTNVVPPISSHSCATLAKNTLVYGWQYDIGPMLCCQPYTNIVMPMLCQHWHDDIATG